MNRSHLPLAASLLLACQDSSLPAAIVTSSFGGAINNNWNTAANWAPAVVPKNNATDQYEVTIPGGTNVFVNTGATINTLDVVSGGTVTMNAFQSLTVLGDVTNNGLILGSGTSGTLRFSENVDQVVRLSGNGTYRLASIGASISGATPSSTRPTMSLRATAIWEVTP